MIEPGSTTGAILGGALIGTSAVLMYWLHGRIFGVSGLAAGLIGPGVNDRTLRALLLLGMLAGGALVARVWPQAMPGAVDAGPVWLIAAGLLVGFGTRLGSGCTSGHGVCGLSRLSPRSAIATITFMVVAAATVFIVRHLMGIEL